MLFWAAFDYSCDARRVERVLVSFDQKVTLYYSISRISTHLLQFHIYASVLGGGIPESRRALDLSETLGIKILPSQVVQGYSSFRTLLDRFQNDFIVATGKGEPAVVCGDV